MGDDPAGGIVATSEIEGWHEIKKILVILAHPDDPEFFCGATIAHWADSGHEIIYCLLTRGDKGVQNKVVSPRELAMIREGEQRRAANVLGVKRVRFLDFEDGCLQPDLASRKAVVRVIREEKPDIVVTSDPTNYFPHPNRINHPDHRIAGQIVSEAIFPASGNPLYFPDLIAEGLPTHQVKEVWYTVTMHSNTEIDVTAFWETKIAALREHNSQIPDVKKMESNQRSRRTEDSSEQNPRYRDRFYRVIFQ